MNDGSDHFRDAFRSRVLPRVADFRPDVIIISAGFDAHQDDPIGSLGLATEDYATLTHILREVANTYCKGRVVSCLEGGYDLAALAESVEAHLGALVATEAGQSQ